MPALLLLGTAVGVVALDLASKALATSELDAARDLPLGFELELSRNDGVAFGLLGDVPAPILIVVALVFTCLLLVAAWHFTLPWAPVALLVGGGIANLIDRVGDGSVTDFIDPPAWATFNLADGAITLGMVLLVVALLGSERVSDPAREFGSAEGHARRTS